MKNVKAVVMGIFFLINIIAVSLIAGNEHGNGGDDKLPENGSIWFLGKDRSVRICYDISSEFPVSMVDIRKNIFQASLTWKNYYNDRFGYYNPALTPAFNFYFLSKCDGSEDLRFLFGVTNDEVEQVKKQYHNPIALAHRSSYDLDAGWGKGFVWVSLLNDINWNDPYKLKAILLHELGHVYGCEHVEGTIMTENIRKRIKENHLADVLAKIDGRKELILNPWLGLEFEYSGTINLFNSDEQQARETFKIFTGIYPQGKVLAKLKKETKNDDELTLTLSDSEKSFTLLIQNLHSGSYFPGSGVVFKSVRNIINDEGGKRTDITFVDGGQAAINYGTIRSASGNEYAVIFERNSGSIGSPAKLNYLSQGEPRDLFTAQ